MPGDARAPIRVLIVDDHQMLAESLLRLLEEDPGITVVGTAPNAAIGLERARVERPDIVVMDFHLPDMDGAAATRLLKAELPAVRVVALTGSDRPGAYQAMLDAGSDAWVRKTRAVHDLRAAVRSVHAGQPVADDELADLPRLDELVVHYQPVVRLADERVVGFESLVRWSHPVRGVLAPGMFLAAAEATGFVNEIGRRVATLAVRQLASWQQRFPSEDRLWVSINVSASGLTSPDTAASLAAAIAESAIDPTDVVLEITETVMLEESDTVLASLQHLKDLGVRLALDDFGTAFSSLSYLRRFPFDEIKLDTSFTAGLPHAPRSVLLVEAILQLATTLEIPVVAEGIERREQADCLRDRGCELGQGYLYARPAPADAVERLLVRR